MKKFWRWLKTKGWPWVLGALAFIGVPLGVLFALAAGRPRRVLENQLQRRDDLSDAFDDVREREQTTLHKIETSRDTQLERVETTRDEDVSVIEVNHAEALRRSQANADETFQKDQPADELRSKLDALLDDSERKRGS